MSYRLRKEALKDRYKRNHSRHLYFETVEVTFDGVYLNAVVNGKHARDIMCRIHHYQEVVDSGGEADAVDSGPDAGDFSVSSLESKLDDGDFDSQLLQLLASEESGKNRKTAIQAIQDRIDFIGE